jgi:hypothetical protein
MWPNLWRAFGITWRNKTTLFRVYLCISGVAWVTLVGGLYIWAKLPPTATRVAFVLLQFIIVLQLLTRLWQRASAVTWYQRHVAIVLEDAADLTIAAPVELVEPVPALPEEVSESESQELTAASEPEAPPKPTAEDPGGTNEPSA